MVNLSNLLIYDRAHGCTRVFDGIILSYLFALNICTLQIIGLRAKYIFVIMYMWKILVVNFVAIVDCFFFDLLHAHIITTLISASLNMQCAVWCPAYGYMA